MFVVTQAEAASIQAAFDQGGEFSAAVEGRHLFPEVTVKLGRRRGLSETARELNRLNITSAPRAAVSGTPALSGRSFQQRTWHETNPNVKFQV